MSRSLMQRFPAIEDLAARAARRLPRFALDYLEGGAGREQALLRNVTAFDAVQLVPRYLRDVHTVSTATPLFGREWSLPFGIAPVGLCGLLWPGTERFLAAAATEAGIPYTLSTVSTATIEEIGEICAGTGWFQLYSPSSDDIRRDLLRRAREAGFDVLVLTIDVPTPARRERGMRSGLRIPPRINVQNVSQALRCPAWCAATVKAGLPRFRTLEPYAFADDMAETAAFIQGQLSHAMTRDEIERLRDQWAGTLVVKGVLHPEDAGYLKAIGVDALQVSNHGGRQSDAVPPTLTQLPLVREAVGNDMPLLLDSGVRSGLDVARALASGADFVLGGRAFLYGVAALGEAGAAHAIAIWQDELLSTLRQIGCVDVRGLNGAWRVDSQRLTLRGEEGLGR